MKLINQKFIELYKYKLHKLPPIMNHHYDIIKPHSEIARHMTKSPWE